MSEADFNTDTFVVWDNDKMAFVESVGREGIFHTTNLDAAFQFPDEEAARQCVTLLDNGVVFKWVD